MSFRITDILPGDSFFKRIFEFRNMDLPRNVPKLRKMSTFTEIISWFTRLLTTILPRVHNNNVHLFATDCSKSSTLFCKSCEQTDYQNEITKTTSDESVTQSAHVRVHLDQSNLIFSMSI